MISATYFGEITELDSRAVWYSDEEDDEEDEPGFGPKSSTVNPVGPVSHETFRSNVRLNFQKATPDPKKLMINTCVISLSSQFKFAKFDNTPLVHLGNFDTVGKAFVHPLNNNCNQQAEKKEDEYLLWLLFDAAHQYLVGHEVGYFVELLRDKLQDEFCLTLDCPVILLSRKYSSNEQLEYLINYKSPSRPLPFKGRPLLPPSIITNQFESSLFEQLTLSIKPAIVVCLPDPKNFWFDKTKDWPEIPNQIIEHKLNDDNLDKTLIFT